MTDSELLFATEEEIAFEVALLIKQARIDTQKTQDEFAKEVGIPHATYRLFEQSGKGSFLNVIKVLTHLGHKDVLIKALRRDEIEVLGIDAFMDKSRKKVKTKVQKKRPKK